MSDAPLPSPTPDSLPYWQGLLAGKLVLQRCGACGLVRHYPRPVCSACFSVAVEWVEASGAGTVHSWTVTHHPFLPSIATPYALVTADLPEGVRLLAPLRGPLDHLRVGAPLRCTFERNGEWATPAWRFGAE